MSSEKNFIQTLKKHPENYYIIHYSCQNLNDDNEALSPRITSVVLEHFKSRQTISFSTHSIAEELGFKREEVIENFDTVEKQLLGEFFKFISERKDKYWIHWNMRNLAYGFEHLSHRYKVLNGSDPVTITFENRINLNDVLSNLYGSNYAEHPKLLSLMKLNGGQHRHFLTGKEEVEAFTRHEFIKMYNSTLCKVGFMYMVLRLISIGKLNTKSNGFWVTVERLLESREAKLLCLISAVLAIPGYIYFGLKYLQTFL